MRTLVLGGGGPLGIAWEAGLTAGLAEGGVEVSVADRIIGTSAGAVVGAQLASGRPPHSLADAQAALGRREAANKTAGINRPDDFRPPDVGPVIMLMMRPLEPGETEQDRRMKLGALALAAKTISEADYLQGFGNSFGAWPGTFACTAVDVATGELKVFDRSNGADLRQGVAASCAIPGVFPSVTIAGTRYMDGGVRSATGIDLAAGATTVLAIAVVGDLGRERQMARIHREIAGLGGIAVELLIPDEDSVRAFGPNPMDPSGHTDVVYAGLAQGRRQAAQIKGFWGETKLAGS